jgi:hypothetical protein
MRPDMFKVIVERPRVGSRWYNASVKHDRNRVKTDDVDDLPSRLPIKPKTGNFKYLNENLSPLRRFLVSRVGDSWDDIYSEISKYIKPGNTVQEHVRDHLKDFVEMNTALIDGKVYYLAMYFRDSAWIPVEDLGNGRRSDAGLYVHPVTRRLCNVPTTRKAAWKRREEREKLNAQKMVVVNKHLRFVLITPKDRRGNDLPPEWFRVTFEDVHKGLFKDIETVGFNGRIYYSQRFLGKTTPHILVDTPLAWKDAGSWYNQPSITEYEKFLAQARRSYNAAIYPVAASTASNKDIRKYNLRK